MSAESSTQPNSSRQANPTALSVADLTRLLSSLGGSPVTAEQGQADIDNGAPVGPNGRINLVHYAAWLLREVQGD